MSSLLDHAFYTDSYGGAYELTLSAWGEGVLTESALLDLQKPDAILQAFKKRFRRYPRSISLLLEDPHAAGCDFGYTGVDSALLEKLETLKELILPASVTRLDLTPKLEKIFTENDTLIRGPFDSFAERFAAERKLRFRPADFIFAEYDSTAPPESTRLTLIFTRGGNVEIKEDISSPGTSASNTLGGSFTHSLPRDFYNALTAGEIAARFGAGLRSAILEDGRLADFLEKAKAHGYYEGKN